MATTRPIDIITNALIAVNALAAGETPPPEKASQGLDLLNDSVLESWSNDHLMLYCSQEVIHTITANDQIYSIGQGGDIAAAFTGSISGDDLTITAISSGCISVGMIISGTGVATGTTITSYATGTGGSGVAALGTYKVSQSQTVPSVSAVGSVVSVTVGNPGAYFSAIPTISFSGGGGSGATAVAGMRFAEGSVSGPSGGTGYTMGDIVTATTGVGTQASWLVTSVAAGAITGRTFLNYGNYTTLPTSGSAVSGGTGTGATFTYGAGAFQLQSVTVTAGGTLYATPPTVTVQAIASLVQATATSAISGSVGTTIPMTGYYPRPLRVTNAFVRINSSGGPQDYPVNVRQYQDFARIGMKQLPGPWPTDLYYQPSMPLGIINYFPNPAQGEMHIFCDMQIVAFQTLYDTIVLPPGYKAALTWCLAEFLLPLYPATGAATEVRALIPEYAGRARAHIKRTNMQPMQEMHLDPVLTRGRSRDAGWILYGGFIN